jgi:hypothetical protein
MTAPYQFQTEPALGVQLAEHDASPPKKVGVFAKIQAKSARIAELEREVAGKRARIARLEAKLDAMTAECSGIKQRVASLQAFEASQKASVGAAGETGAKLGLGVRLGNVATPAKAGPGVPSRKSAAVFPANQTGHDRAAAAFNAQLKAAEQGATFVQREVARQKRLAALNGRAGRELPTDQEAAAARANLSGRERAVAELHQKLGIWDVRNVPPKR